MKRSDMKATLVRAVSLCFGKSLPRLPVLLVFAFAAVMAFQTARGLYDSTEGRYAECAREMSQAGTWLKPVLNGQPHWTKPPVTYMAIIGPYKVFGPTTFAARFYLIPCYLLTVFSIGWLSIRLWRDRESARLCALVYATMAFPLVTSNVVSSDYPLTAALALTQACFWEAMRRKSPVMVHATWLCLALAFLTKGPPALLFLPAMFVVWARQPREARRRCAFFAPTAVLLFLVVGLSWYAWEAWRNPGLLGYWLKDEVIDRSFSKASDRNAQFYKVFELYLPILLFGTLPWSAWLAFRWRSIRGLWVAQGGAGLFRAGLSDEVVWLMAATLLPLAVFVVSRSRLPLYLLPLFVPFAAGAGRLLLVVEGRNPRFRRIVLVTMSVMFALFALGKSLSPRIMYKDKDAALLHRNLTEVFGVGDPTRLAVFGDTRRNALSYYYGHALPIVKGEGVVRWMFSGGERFLLYRQNRQETEVDALMGGRAVERRELPGRWRLMRFSGSPGEHASSGQ